jgi:ATP synthase, F0 subunit c
MIGIGVGLAAGLAALGAAVGNGLLVASFLQSVARQPEMEKKLRSSMIMGIAFVEGLAVISIVIAFILLGKL